MKICITGGGTGGHLMIAEALVEAGVSRGHELIFIGSTKGQDRKYFEKHSSFSKVYFLETTGVVDKKGLGKVLSLFSMIKAFFHARKILKQHRIQATYSVGGFSAAPASFATLSLRKPLFIHEQNAVAGKLNSMLRPYAKEFISAYEKDSKIQGYPVKEFFHKTARIRKEIKTIIFLGGSHGARAINDLAIELAWRIKNQGIKIIHQAGEADYDRVKKEYEKLLVDVELYSFTKELPELISQADFAVSRSGASTLWELSANGIPAFYIPYPYAAGDHQYHNANFIVQNNLGWCEREGEDLKEKIINVIKEPIEQKSQQLLEYSQKEVALKMIEEVEKSI